MASDFPARPQAATLHQGFSDISSGSGSTTPSQQSKEPSEASCPPSGRKQPSPDQRNKVFVGGVPQDYSQDDLKKLFQEYAPVKRAWVQQHKTKRSATERSAPQNHRGFGWVVFQDPVVKKDQRGPPSPGADGEGRGSYVDHLMGAGDSRLVPLGDGRHVEVKRAKDAQEMKEHQAPPAKTTTGSASRGLVVGGRGPPGTGVVWPATTGLGPMRPPPPGLPPPAPPASLAPADGGRPQVSAPTAASNNPIREQGAREQGGSWPRAGHRQGSPVRVPYPPPNPTGVRDPIYCRAPVYSNRLLGADEVLTPAAVHGQESFVERLTDGIPPRVPPTNTLYI